MGAGGFGTYTPHLTHPIPTPAPYQPCSVLVTLLIRAAGQEVTMRMLTDIYVTSLYQNLSIIYGAQYLTDYVVLSCFGTLYGLPLVYGSTMHYQV